MKAPNDGDGRGSDDPEAAIPTPATDPASGGSSGSSPSGAPTSSRGLSRREFAQRAGIGTAAAAGFAWSAPKISTIKFLSKAAAGSRPPTTPTTGAVPLGSLGGKISVSAASPCVGTDLRVAAAGFVPGAGVAIQIDSADHPIGIARADAKGAIDAVVTIPATGPTGPRTLLAVGPQPGGTTLTLTTPITIKTAAECAEGPVSATGDPVAPAGASTANNSGSLPLTGSDAVDLAVIGGASAIGGRLLYGASRRDRPGLDGTDR